MLNSYYTENKVLQEEPIDIYISSSWLDNGHWMWKIVDQAFNGMNKRDGSIFLAFDESITLKHNLKNHEVHDKRKEKTRSYDMEN